MKGGGGGVVKLGRRRERCGGGKEDDVFGVESGGGRGAWTCFCCAWVFGLRLGNGALEDGGG